MNKIEELINQIKEDRLERKSEDKKNNIWVIVVSVLAVIGILVAIGYAIYRFLGPSYFEDFEDDYEDDFDDDFFEDDDDDDIEIVEKKEEKDAE